MYEVNLKRLPKKKNDINNIRCIVLGVLDHFQVNSELLKISENRYQTYIDKLLEEKIIIREKRSKGYAIENFIIFDETKIDLYRKSSFYKFIERRILPLLPVVLAVKQLM